ncbi:aminotransferase class I/II-fold pyridoxal phosphate-dependent enzyme [Actinacidiphila yanglinensis]|uniref:aminotransferase class I/II-fold pyridoxal phosphate-dependent enzyme n=1 Tax=Actinacidiphila yanglinensis TaxID=310779 RepID=UPI000CDEE112|nr:aminotransferase class I/II-fold pyridoxal phosphate-dependent enzyme [Actinacidiphila yanglinensis]
MLGEYPITGRGASTIAADIERAVGAGALKPGAALPPLRELARELDVNPNTVASAYRLLRDRGVIETAGRRGSRVRARPAVAPREAIRIEVPSGTRDLSTGNPDLALLPPLAASLADAAAHHALAPGLYGSTVIDPELAELARAALDADGVPDGPIGLTSGSLDAIERVLAAHLRPGDAVAVEDPGWGSVIDLVPAMGLRAVPVAVDDEGPVTAEVERALAADIRALIVTDRGQNPTGAALSAARAAELRGLLAAHPHVLVIDDDHLHHLVDLPLHTLSGATEHWALVRSVAKAYGPDLRLAVYTCDPVTVARVRGRHRLGAGWVSHLLQRTVVHLWQTQAVDPVRTARSYAMRREALLRALAERGVSAHGRCGLNAWVPVSDETGAVAGLLQHGWAVAPGARFRLRSGPGIRVTVSPLDLADIDPLADSVATVLRSTGPGHFG